ncbi:MAG: threonine ammonia-lyase, partial [Pseudomonadota bacterium]
VAQAGGNVIEVSHQRLFAAPSVQSAELELMVEVRDVPQANAITALLEAGDYVVRKG